MSFSIAYLSYHYFNGALSRNATAWSSRTEEMVVYVFLAPLLETLVFQLYAYKLVLFLAKKINLPNKLGDWLFVMGSGLFFSACHNYNWPYNVSALLGGLCLNYSYLHFKKAKFHPFLSVVLIHALYNLMVFFIRNTLI